VSGGLNALFKGIDDAEQHHYMQQDPADPSLE